MSLYFDTSVKVCSKLHPWDRHDFFIFFSKVQPQTSVTEGHSPQAPPLRLQYFSILTLTYISGSAPFSLWTCRCIHTCRSHRSPDLEPSLPLLSSSASNHFSPCLLYTHAFSVCPLCLALSQARLKSVFVMQQLGYLRVCPIRLHLTGRSICAVLVESMCSLFCTLCTIQ